MLWTPMSDEALEHWIDGGRLVKSKTGLKLVFTNWNPVCHKIGINIPNMRFVKTEVYYHAMKKLTKISLSYEFRISCSYIL